MSYRETIYNTLRKHGMTEAGALAMLGNFECESTCEPNRVQGDGSAYRTISKSYTSNYMNGVWGKDRFVNGMTGYGLAQWTYPTRQAELWDFWKASGKALDDPVMQCDFAVKELKRDYPELWNLLCANNDVYTLTKRICYDFENPLVKNVDARFKAANRIKHEIDLNGGGADPEPQPQPQPKPQPAPAKDHALTLRTIDWHCENFKEFALLKALLECRNYDTELWDNDGVWNAVKEFQMETGLSADAIVGNQTWTALLRKEP